MGFVQIRFREEWLRYIASRSLEDRNRLVVLNQPLVRRRADRHFTKLGHPCWTTVEDLEGRAMPRLIRAVELFNPSMGVQFGTYATWAIDRELWRSAAEYREIPVNLSREKRDRTPIKIPISQLNDRGFHPSTRDPERTLLCRNWLQKLRKFLPERYHQVLIYRFQEGLTLEQTGDRLGITRERVRQLELKAIEKLQLHTESELLFEDERKRNGLRVSELEG